jgi:hypothetical protein
MTMLTIQDLSRCDTLDHHGMKSVHGGNSQPAKDFGKEWPLLPIVEIPDVKAIIADFVKDLPLPVQSPHLPFDPHAPGGPLQGPF